MWSLWELPTSCEIEGREYAINTDYRDILQVIAILQDRELEERVKISAVLQIFYVEDMPNLQPALDTLMLFINCGEADDEKIPQPKTIDWEQDYLAIVADVNHAAGLEVRAASYLHWFTFISYFNSIGEGQLSQLVTIRNKLRKGEPLEKYEREYYYSNVSKVKFREKYTSEEQEEVDYWNKVLGA